MARPLVAAAALIMFVAQFLLVGAAGAQVRFTQAPSGEVLPSPPRLEASRGRPETVQADVSTRSVSVTSSFTGTEIVIFGAIDNSRQTSADANLYDVVIVVEGTAAPLVARRKEQIAGIWLNANSITFDRVPSYYAIVSTRPADEITQPDVLKQHRIGFAHVPMIPDSRSAGRVSPEYLEAFKNSVIRLKRKDGLYREEEFGVVFVGSSLFRATIELPANVPVGPMDARVYLFRDGKMLSQFQTRVNMQREGLEALLHTFAFSFPFIYGIFTVLLSIGAGLLASLLFDRARH